MGYTVAQILFTKRLQRPSNGFILLNTGLNKWVIYGTWKVLGRLVSSALTVMWLVSRPHKLRLWYGGSPIQEQDSGWRLEGKNLKSKQTRGYFLLALNTKLIPMVGVVRGYLEVSATRLRSFWEDKIPCLILVIASRYFLIEYGLRPRLTQYFSFINGFLLKFAMWPVRGSTPARA